MVLVPRFIDVQNVLCKHDEVSGTAEAGAVVYLSGDSKIAKVVASGNAPFAMLGQRVKASAAGLPQNFQFPGEIGASDARLGDPVLLFQKGGQFDTTHYDLASGVTAGAPLYAKVGEGKLTAAATGVCVDSNGDAVKVAVAVNTLSVDEAAAGKFLTIALQLN
jgi:hypothetical protein